MDLGTIISPDAVLANLKPNSKRQLLQELSSAIAPLCGAPERLVFETMMQRERLGSTGIGNGVAIPHGKLTNVDTITGLFARLAKPVPFDSIDDQPVDIVFMLLAPEGSGADHLKALSRIARLLRSRDYLAQLRALSDAEALYSLITDQEDEDAA